MSPRKKTQRETQLFSLRLPVDLHRELRHHAVDDGRPLNEILVEVIAQWWESEKTRRRSKRR